jgi:hypothetical protein
MNDDPCPGCPCKSICLRWPGFCRWAAEEPPDPVKLRHICERSARGPTPPRPPAVDYGVAPGERPRSCCS